MWASFSDDHESFIVYCDSSGETVYLDALSYQILSEVSSRPRTAKDLFQQFVDVEGLEQGFILQSLDSLDELGLIEKA